MSGLAAFAWFAAGFVTCLALVGFALVREARRDSARQRQVADA